MWPPYPDFFNARSHGWRTLTSIAVYSYSVAAVGFFLLIGLLLTIWRGRSHVAPVAIACALTALW